MMTQISKLTGFAAISLLAGCLAGGNNNGGMYGNNGQYGNNGGYNNGQYGNNGGYNNGQYGGNNAGYGGAMGGLEMAVINAIIQSMAGGVFNGAIGSQLAPGDQTFRLQQLGRMMQSGNITQAQQWVNPNTGNTIALNPVGQLMLNPQTQQQCQKMEETSIQKNGQQIHEARMACKNPQTGKWNFVQ